jgi:hypothetical protein
MNTFKIKVLLIISNTHLFRSLRRAIVVWLTACVTGCVVLYGLDLFFLSSVDDLVLSVALSLVFSTPAVAAAAVVFYFLYALPGTIARIASSSVAIVITSSVVVGIVSWYFNLPYVEVSKTLYPFVLSAFVYFFFIARKQILVSYPV